MELDLSKLEHAKKLAEAELVAAFEGVRNRLIERVKPLQIKDLDFRVDLRKYSAESIAVVTITLGNGLTFK